MEQSTHPQHLSELREEVRQLKQRYVPVHTQSPLYCYHGLSSQLNRVSSQEESHLSGCKS